MNDTQLKAAIQAAIRKHTILSDAQSLVAARVALAVVREAWGKDAERLDWMERALLVEKDSISLTNGHDGDRRPMAFIAYRPYWQKPGNTDTRTAYALTLREAIDAARAQEKQS